VGWGGGAEEKETIKKTTVTGGTGAVGQIKGTKRIGRKGSRRGPFTGKTRQGAEGERLMRWRKRKILKKEV